MKKILMMLAMAATVGLAGCGQVSQDELDELKQKQSAQAAKLKAKDGEIEALQSQLDELQKARTGYDDSELKARLAALEVVEPVDKFSTIEKALAAQDALIEELLIESKSRSTAPDVPEPPVESSQSEPEATKFTEADQARVDELTTMMNTSGTTPEQRTELTELLQKADKETREKTIDALRELVNKEPENQYIRLALAEAMTTQFQDVGGGIQAGIHAANIVKELDKATDIDPDYYDAHHFKGLFYAGYPKGLPEFDNAKVYLDKALKLQEQMIWEDRFADIHATYGSWYQKQSMYDEALTKVQEGLDKAPRHEGLLLRKESIEQAKAAAEGDE